MREHYFKNDLTQTIIFESRFYFKYNMNGQKHWKICFLVVPLNKQPHHLISSNVDYPYYPLWRFFYQVLWCNSFMSCHCHRTVIVWLAWLQAAGEGQVFLKCTTLIRILFLRMHQLPFFSRKIIRWKLGVASSLLLRTSTTLSQLPVHLSPCRFERSDVVGSPGIDARLFLPSFGGFSLCDQASMGIAGVAGVEFRMIFICNFWKTSQVSV